MEVPRADDLRPGRRAARHPRALHRRWPRTVGGTWRRSTGRRIARARARRRQRRAGLAFVLILAGLATKIGWAPVHNWLPDAHSEAPPPVSALLSAALLPTVMLIAWRVAATVGTAAAAGRRRRRLHRLRARVARVRGAVPVAAAAAQAAARLLEPRAHGDPRARHRLRAPLATAGVVVHVAGHALAKALGFYAAIPLLRHDSRGRAAAAARPRGDAAPSTAGAIGVSLGSLSGLPPSPLFFSELLDPARRRAGGTAGGRRRRRRADGARLPRARARADRRARRQRRARARWRPGRSARVTTA